MGYIFGMSLASIIIIAIIVLAIIVFVVWLSVKAHQRQVTGGKEGMVGEIAVVDTPLEPKGVVLVEGERWTAISESGNIEPGSEVIVNRVDGLKLYVSKKK